MKSQIRRLCGWRRLLHEGGTRERGTGSRAGQTVLGPISPERRVCMVHEHLVIDAWDMWPVPNYSLIVEDVDLVTEEVQSYRAAGGAHVLLDWRRVVAIGHGRPKSVDMFLSLV
jgi:hypothetical protein